MAFLEQIKKLYDCELYSDVELMCQFFLSINANENEVLQDNEKVCILLYLGDAYMHLSRHRRANDAYKRADGLWPGLQTKMFRNFVNPYNKDSHEEIKFQLYKSHMNMNHFPEALNVLENIPSERRNPKVHFSLANLYRNNGRTEDAIEAFKYVLEVCPLSLESAEALIEMGVSEEEVKAMVLPENPTSSIVNWLHIWIKAHVFKFIKEYENAITSFRYLSQFTIVRNNVNVLLKIAECYHLDGQVINALLLFPRIFDEDPLLEKGIDFYAYLLFKESQRDELEKLVDSFLPVLEHTFAHYVVWGYMFYTIKQLQKAVYYAHKAITMNSRSIEALILKGTALYDLEKYEQSLLHFRKAMSLAPYRYEIHVGIIENYYKLNRQRETILIANNFILEHKETTRSLCLLSYVYSRDPIMAGNCKPLLLQALEIDPHCLEAALQLAEIYIKNQEYVEAIEILEREMELRPTAKFHMVLAFLYETTHQKAKALEHLHSVIEIDPTNLEALQSLYRLDDTLTTIENVNVRGNINESLISGFGPPIFVDPRHPFADPRQPLGEPDLDYEGDLEDYSLPED